MNKNNKIILIFYIFLGISFTVGVVTISSSYDEIILPDITPRAIKTLEVTSTTNNSIEDVFLLFTNIEDYPKILPRNILSVEIINKTDSIIFAKEKISESGITTTLTVKHSFIPYESHTLEIIDGDAENTIITQTFEKLNSQTKILTVINFELKGILVPFSFIPKSNLEHAAETIVNSFLDYGFSNYDKYEKIVDNLYRELLLRPADNEALSYWGEKFRTHNMDEKEFRNAILNSDEYKIISTTKNLKSLNSISDESKIMIDSLYQEILDRNVDDEGLIYWGSLLESEYFDQNSIRKMILKSQEAIDLKRFDGTRTIIKDLFQEVLDREPSPTELEHYKYLVDIEEITFEEIRNELISYQS